MPQDQLSEAKKSAEASSSTEREVEQLTGKLQTLEQDLAKLQEEHKQQLAEVSLQCWHTQVIHHHFLGVCSVQCPAPSVDMPSGHQLHVGGEWVQTK